MPFIKKYCRVQQAKDENMAHAHCMPVDYDYKYTHRLCNTHFLSTTTTVAQTRLNITLYVHWLSLFFLRTRNPGRFQIPLTDTLDMFPLLNVIQLSSFN
jgi:hypothetical protein